MSATVNMSSYQAFGLTIKTDFYLPELIPVDCMDHMGADVTLEQTDLSGLWKKYAEPDAYYYINKNFCMINVPDVAIYLIKDGKTIFYSPAAGADENQIRLYLLGTCFGVLLMQRGILPLHGSCVIVHGKAYAILGESGAGKSTLAAAFLKRAFPLLTDDVIAVKLSETAMPLGIPSYPQQKLWQESLNRFGLESDQFKPIYQRETKFSIPVDVHFAEKPVPLAGIFILNKTEQEAITIAPVPKLVRFPVLYWHTYRQFMIDRLGLLDWHFAFSTHVVNNLEFYQIKRPISRFTADELVDSMLHIIMNDSDAGGKQTDIIYREGGELYEQNHFHV